MGCVSCYSHAHKAAEDTAKGVIKTKYHIEATLLGRCSPNDHSLCSFVCGKNVNSVYEELQQLFKYCSAIS